MAEMSKEVQERFDFVCACICEKAYMGWGDACQFINLGVPVFATLCKMLGKTKEEMKAWIERKMVGLADFEKALSIIGLGVTE